MKKWLMIFLVALGLVGGFACKNSPTTPPVTNPPTINSFTANPTTIHAGESSTLTWNVSNATTVTINQGIGAVSKTTGTKSVTPAATTTYTLTATNSSGTRTANCVVTLADSPPTIDSFTATPAAVKRGEASTLAWSVQNATTITIDQGIGAVAATGSTQVSPDDTTTYTLTATNAGGDTTATAQVEILPAAVLTVSFDPASPVWIYDGDTNTTTANFSIVLTETNNVGGDIDDCYLGTYLNDETQLSSQNVGGGSFAALGSVSLPCAVVVTGQPDFFAFRAEGFDSNGYEILIRYYSFPIVYSAPAPMQVMEAIEGVTPPWILRAIEELKIRKR
jgi:hypothetical protein